MTVSQMSCFDMARRRRVYVPWPEVSPKRPLQPVGFRGPVFSVIDGGSLKCKSAFFRARDRPGAGLKKKRMLFHADVVEGPERRTLRTCPERKIRVADSPRDDGTPSCILARKRRTLLDGGEASEVCIHGSNRGCWSTRLRLISVGNLNTTSTTSRSTPIHRTSTLRSKGPRLGFGDKALI